MLRRRVGVMLLAMGDVAYLWVEGVDFDATLLDTSDLSTVRGASLALLRLGEDVGEHLKGAPDVAVERVFVGASQAAYRLTGRREAIGAAVAGALASLRSDPGGPPYSHLSIVHGLRFVGDQGHDAALKAARAVAKASQQRKLSVPFALESAAIRPCKFDRLRGGVEEIALGVADGKAELAWASRSVAARRAYGRKQRQAFYGEVLPADVLASVGGAGAEEPGRFADSFENIVAGPPDWVPLGARNKIGVLYLDGNGFGSIRDRIAREKGAIEALSLFSERLTALQSTELLPAALRAAADDGVSKMRFETLLWGGDEVRFVVPAWRALDLAGAVMACLAEDDWKIEGHRLTFTGALVIANYKTPIASLVTATETLAETLKASDRTGNQIAVEVLESLEIPADGIVAARARLMGLRPDDPAPYFALAGDRFGATLDRIAQLRQELPATQLHRWLRVGRQRRRFASDADDAPLREAIQAYEEHGGGSGWIDRLALNAGAANRPLAWDMLLASLLRDYVAGAADEGATA